jgi:tetratricopeptide (TPR) repeat protein
MPRLVFTALFLAFALQLHADDAPNPVFVHRAQAAFQDAKAQLDSHPNDTNALATLARTAFDWADIQTTDSPRKSIANAGISAAQHLIAIDPGSVPGHYYLGLDLGELAETETLGALKLVRQMESEFILVLHTNAAFDYAGPDRNLGLLYRDAPGWPASIGNRAKAREHLDKAYKIAPNYPESLMNLIESELKWDQSTAAQSHLQTLDQLWPKARQEFSGQQWESAWADWSKRRDDARKKLSSTSAAPPAVSPHNQP